MEIKKCPNCGSIIESFQTRCSACGFELTGQKVSDTLQDFIAEISKWDDISYRNGDFNENKKKKSSVELKTDNSTTVSYTIVPEKAKDAKVTWESSNESVATVSESGKITAKGDGSCTITVSAGGKTDSLTVTVKSGPDFMSIYNTYCDSTYATVGSDGSYLSIDTNPYDIDDYTASGSIQAIISVNAALGLPDYIFDDMSRTTALMGRQSASFDDVTVSWSYHPDKGLAVTYKAN